MSFRQLRDRLTVARSADDIDRLLVAIDEFTAALANQRADRQEQRDQHISDAAMWLSDRDEIRREHGRIYGEFEVWERKVKALNLRLAALKREAKLRRKEINRMMQPPPGQVRIPVPVEYLPSPGERSLPMVIEAVAGDLGVSYLLRPEVTP